MVPDEALEADQGPLGNARPLLRCGWPITVEEVTGFWELPIQGTVLAGAGGFRTPR